HALPLRAVREAPFRVDRRANAPDVQMRECAAVYSRGVADPTGAGVRAEKWFVWAQARRAVGRSGAKGVRCALRRDNGNSFRCRPDPTTSAPAFPIFAPAKRWRNRLISRRVTLGNAVKIFASPKKQIRSCDGRRRVGLIVNFVGGEHFEARTFFQHD